MGNKRDPSSKLDELKNHAPMGAIGVVWASSTRSVAAAQKTHPRVCRGPGYKIKSPPLIEEVETVVCPESCPLTIETTIPSLTDRGTDVVKSSYFRNVKGNVRILCRGRPRC